MYYLINIIGAWFLADILTGLVHWIEDRYIDGTSRFTFINSVSMDNDIHHESPMAFTRFSLWENINTSLPGAWAIAGILHLTGAPLILPLMFLFAAFANIIHRWAHLPDRKLNLLIRLLQASGLFITGAHHSAHHYYKNGARIEKEDTTEKWCAMTIYMNPVLDKLNIFLYLEYALLIINIRVTKGR